MTRALRSVIDQSVPPLEILVVDNGPVEGADARRNETLDVARGTSVDVEWLSLPPRSGPAMSRNYGAWRSRAPYVAFLDDDDAFAQGYLEAMMAAIAAHDPDLLYGRKRVLDDDGNVVRIKDVDSQPRNLWLDRLLSHKNHGFGGQNVVARRDALFGIGGFPVDLRSGQDRAMVIAALRADLDVVGVHDAIVDCYTVEGYRAKADPFRWTAWLKITVENWSVMRWRVRVTAVRKTLRDAASSLYKAVRARAR